MTGTAVALSKLATQVVAQTRALLAVPSVVGFEAPLLGRLERLGRQLGRPVMRHAGGLVWRGAEGAGALSVHVDRHGLVASGDREFEYAAFARRRLAGLTDAATTRRTLEKVGARFVGERVYAYHPETGAVLAEGRVDATYVCPVRDNLVFEIPSLGRFPTGAPASYRPLCERRREVVTGQLDNCISVAVAAALCRAGFAGSVLLTREEEIGRSFEHLEAMLREIPQPGPLLVLDTSPFGDRREVEPGVVVLRRRDSNGVFAEPLVAALEASARELAIPVLFKDEWLQRRAAAAGRDPTTVPLGSTELGRLVAATGGERNGACVQIPTIGYHTNREQALLPSIDNALRLIAAVLLGRDGRPAPPAA